MAVVTGEIGAGQAFAQAVALDARAACFHENIGYKFAQRSSLDRDHRAFLKHRVLFCAYRVADAIIWLGPSRKGDTRCAHGLKRCRNRAPTRERNARAIVLPKMTYGYDPAGA